MIELNEFDQQSAAWLIAKLGKIGGTRLKQVFSTNNLDLVDELIAEMGSGITEETYVTAAMQRGIDLEPHVLKMFAKLYNAELEQPGLCVSDAMPYLVCSPDAFTKCREIGVEVKCPSTKKHVQYIRQGTLPAEYKWQVVNYFLVNEKCKFVYFISFDDRYKPRPYFEILVSRADVHDLIDQALVALPKFWEKVEKYRGVVE